jgi:hypothetical protein
MSLLTEETPIITATLILVLVACVAIQVMIWHLARQASHIAVKAVEDRYLLEQTIIQVYREAAKDMDFQAKMNIGEIVDTVSKRLGIETPQFFIKSMEVSHDRDTSKVG